MPSVPETDYTLSLGGAFTLFMVMLGPIKALGPFTQLTRNLDIAKVRGIAWRAFSLAIVAVLAGGFVGRALLLAWKISLPSMIIAGGMIFFLVGLAAVLEPYRAVQPDPPALPDAPMLAAMRIAFPILVTPYGIAGVIVLLAGSRDTERTMGILALLAVVMVLNLMAMLFARRFMRGSAPLILQVAGAVLGVLQVALAVELILRGIQYFGAPPRG